MQRKIFGSPGEKRAMAEFTRQYCEKKNNLDIFVKIFVASFEIKKIHKILV